MISQGQTHFLIHERRLQAPPVPIPDQDSGKALGCSSHPSRSKPSSTLAALALPKVQLKREGKLVDGRRGGQSTPAFPPASPAVLCLPSPVLWQPSTETVDGEPSSKKLAVQKKKSGDTSAGTDSGLSPGAQADSK